MGGALSREYSIKSKNNNRKLKIFKRISKKNKNIDSRAQISNLDVIQDQSLKDKLKNEENLSKKSIYKDNSNSDNIKEESNIKSVSLKSNLIQAKNLNNNYNGFLAGDINNNLDDENSVSEKEDELEDKDKEKLEKQIEELTNNIKYVFNNPKIINKDSTDSISRLSTNSNSLCSFPYNENYDIDYELEFYKNENDIRKSYLAKLISKNVWNPNNEDKKYNNIIIFDWDDTLLPTSFLSPGGIFSPNIKLTKDDTLKLIELEKIVHKILTNAIQKGDVFIITNAGKGWVEFSASRFYPNIVDILPKINIISARAEYENAFPGESNKWKIQAFLGLQRIFNVKLVSNIICFGDSLLEMQAGKILGSKFSEAFVKTIKFKEIPKIEELLKQLSVVSQQFNYIYSSVKNMTIKIERKRT